MSKNRLLRLLPILLALALLFSVAVFAVYAEGEDESADETSEVTSAEDSSAAASSEAASSATTSSEAASSAAASSEAASETSAPAKEQKTPSNVPWKLIITVAVIVVIAAVLFILAKTNNKLGQRIAKFFKDYKSEIKKISWMSRKDLLRSTLVVLAVLIAASIVIGLLDFGFSELVKLLSSIG